MLCVCGCLGRLNAVYNSNLCTPSVFDKEENQMCVFCTACALKFEAAAEKKHILLEYPFNGTKASSHKLQIQVYVPDWIF